MTVEAWSLTPEYTIAGTGPYTITHPYLAGAIRASVMTATGLVALGVADFTVAPITAAISGDLTLSPTVATTYAGLPLIIDRVTPDEQGWLAVQGEREAGLEAQLDRTTQSVQELRLRGAGALRIRGELEAFDWTDGTVPILDGTRVISGPTADQITGAQAFAATATSKASEAAASAAEALAKQNSMLRWRGAWVTATAYAPSDIVFFSGSAYVAVVAHTSGVFATDLSASRWALFAQQGASGVGSGDMLKSENLAGLANPALAWANIGGAAIGKLTEVGFVHLAAAAVRLASEGLTSPLDTELATAAWAKAYADSIADGWKYDWHPYNRTALSGSETGIFFTWSSLVASVVTPDFEDGYEYRILGTGWSHNSGTNQNLRLELFRETDAIYGGTIQISTGAGIASLFTFDIELPDVRQSQVVHFVNGRSIGHNTGTPTARVLQETCIQAAQKRTRARITFTSGSIDAGIGTLLRKKITR